MLSSTLRFAPLAWAALLAACGGGDGGGSDLPLQIRTLSNRADLVSGGEVLVEVAPPAGAPLSGLRVTANGSDRTPLFIHRPDGSAVGLVGGLATGDNVLEATAGNYRGARLTVTNSPAQGPVFSGPHITPFYCATPTPQPASGNTPATHASGLSGQPDASCNIAAETRLWYRTTAAPVSAANPQGCSLGLPDPAWNLGATATTVPTQPAGPANPCWKAYTPGSTPVDMATTSTDNGETVPFVVRVERGTMNRGIYDIAVLFNPALPWDGAQPQPQWNRKVYYNFGASTGQPRRQVRPASAWGSSEEQLRRGWLVVANSMTDSARNSNRVLMVETTMMMKEHIVDRYGPIRYTLGTGCSGGSINSNMNASIYPGLLDGIITSCTYPDSETTSMEVGDCTLLVEAYQKPAVLGLWTAMGLTQEQINARKGAINGHPDQSGCHAWFNAFGSNGKAGLYNQRLVANNTTGAIITQPSPTNNCELPNTAVYDPANPSATANLPRCNAWSWGESIWGRAAGTPAANDTRDNTGVQYGLKALLAGTIGPEEFVTLNEAVGGTDRDSTARAARSLADTTALEIAYRAGIVASGRQLARTPIIDLRGWDDSNVNVPPGQTPGTNAIPIHHQWFSWAVRDRIVRDYGDAGNQALWRFARSGLLPTPTLSMQAFTAMDKWLLDLTAASTAIPIEQRVRQTRPTSGVYDTRDFCLLPADPTQSNRILDQAVCDADPYLRPGASPRQVAGGPRSEDVLKCQLKPLAAGDYPAGVFTADQWSRLQAVFGAGVCDWTRPGVGQQGALGPLTFRAGPGGLPFAAPAPVSVPN